MQRRLPNDTNVLVFGILSIVLAFCCSPAGLIFGILAFVQSNSAKAAYDANPSEYLDSSMSKAKTGRILALIGMVVAVLSLIYSIYMFSSQPDYFQDMMNQIQEAQGN